MGFDGDSGRRASRVEVGGRRDHRGRARPGDRDARRRRFAGAELPGGARKRSGSGRASSRSSSRERSPRRPAPAPCRAAVEGLSTGAYRFSRYLSDPRAQRRDRGGSHRARRRRRRREGRRSGRAGRRPRGRTGPRSRQRASVAAESRRVRPRGGARAREAGLRARVLDAKALERLGDGRAARGRARQRRSRPGSSIWSTRRAGVRPGGASCSIGKGVTFDSGGLNLKPGSGMAAMKSDMAGAAAVLAAMTALARMRVPRRGARRPRPGREHDRRPGLQAGGHPRDPAPARRSRSPTPTPRGGWSWPI